MPLGLGQRVTPFAVTCPVGRPTLMSPVCGVELTLQLGRKGTSCRGFVTCALRALMLAAGVWVLRRLSHAIAECCWL